MGGRGAISSIKNKTNYIVVSNNDGTSNLVEQNSGRIIANKLSLSDADRQATLLNNGKVKLKDLGYGENNNQSSTNNKSSTLKSASEIRQSKINYAIETGNYNYLPDDITDKELRSIRKKMRS